jgi:hypothetical protein
MKKILKSKYIALAIFSAVLMIFSACDTEYDNYDAPSVAFSGKLVDSEGDNFPFDASKNLFAFYQSGYGKVDIGTSMYVNDDGEFNQLLYKDNYTLTISNNIKFPFTIDEFPQKTNGQGSDSIHYHVTAPINVNFTVRPFYKISTMKAEFDGKYIIVTFTVKKLNRDAPKLKRVYLYLGSSVNVNTSNKCQKFTTLKDNSTDEQEFVTKIPISYYRSRTFGMINNYRTYAYYRLGIMIDGYNDYYLMSSIQKIEGLNDLE